MPSQTRTPVEEWGQFDVAVCGAGIAGVSAALAAARNGARTLLIEKTVAPGGLCTQGLVAVFLPLCDGFGNQLISGLAEELLRAALAASPPSPNQHTPFDSNMARESRARLMARFEPAAMLLVMEQRLLSAGVTLAYDSVVCDVIRSGYRLDGLIVQNKSGRGAFRTHYVVDATGDADVCHLAGEPLETRKTSGLTAWYCSYDGRNNVRMHTPMGDLADDRAETPSYDPTDWRDVSRFAVDCRRLMREHLDRLNADPVRKRFPLVIPSLPGFRITRGLKGRHVFDAGDAHKPFEDAVGLFGDWRRAGPVYCLPYRTLLPHHTPNLLAAGRAVAAAGEGWDILRAIPVCALTGEVAGAAVSLALDRHDPLAELDLRELRQRLQKMNVILDTGLLTKNAPPGQPEMR